MGSIARIAGTRKTRLCKGNQMRIKAPGDAPAANLQFLDSRHPALIVKLIYPASLIAKQNNAADA